ncbi:MAG: N-acetyltransferase [Chloroflexota bacterium]|nr:N-acetyltransferase [Chloroflexota bacterium]
MVAVLNPRDPTGHIRPLDLSADLNRVADLVEICFPIHRDPDGQTYVREMRKAARDYNLMGWLSQLDDIGKKKPAGFVWDDDGHVIGNLSLIPFQNAKKRIDLLANVAVHPQHRRKGIARALTIHALKHLRRYGESDVWLQVRHDNSSALNLYRSLGFSDRAVRTNWRIKPFEFRQISYSESHPCKLRHRLKEDWNKQQGWLNRTYPQEIRWNLPINFHRLAPGLLQSVSNFLDSVFLRQWGIEVDGETLGWITWQKTKMYANNLWLAFPEDLEHILLPVALGKTVKQLSRRQVISVDYPFGRFQEGFTTLGFDHFRTLIWMRRRL